MEQLNRDPNVARLAGYGSHFLDRVIKEIKPDVYIAVQDIWGVDFAVDKIWFNKINSSIWTTLDSLPILPTAIDKAKKIKNYWVWSDFARRALHELGHTHVKTLEGAIDQNCFHRLDDERKKELRIKSKIPEDAYIAGFVFRNQLRKSVPNLLEGFASFLRKHRDTKAYLLLHTSWAEGWNIHRMADEYNVPKDRILTTYLCQACGNYHISPFTGQGINCPYCGQEKGMSTTGVGFGITEEQLNEVYNLMDVYVHPFTSGGQEIPVQEAKLVELITCVTDYSCGEDLCEKGSGSLSLSWHEYREHGTEFRKASTSPKSIASRLEEVLKMPKNKKRSIEEKSRKWAINKFSVDTIGGKLEKFLDSCEPTNYDFSLKEEERDPNFTVPEIESDSDWLICLYHNMLKMKHVDVSDDGHKYWMRELSQGTQRSKIEKYFREVAAKENTEQQQKNTTIENFIDKDDGGKRILYVMPESSQDMFLSTCLFRSMKETYPDHKIYVATKLENFEILDANEYVHSTMPYSDQMDGILSLQGASDHKGFFDIAFLPYFNTQRHSTYTHNGLDKIAYKDLMYK
jgi:glycosyltransferase involved in cell wall biosynthesis